MNDIMTAVKRILKRHLPAPLVRLLARRQNTSTVPTGMVDFGSFRRLGPISRQFGFDRGTPIDRYYIDRFLDQYAADIHGRVLEVGDDEYTRRFGAQRVRQSDVLHVTSGNPKATFVGDVTAAPNIPSDAFDCVLFLQTLHLIYDMRAAVRALHRILKRGGVLLATFPGISQKSTDEWGPYWQWGFTGSSAERLFGEFFSAQALTRHSYGNVLAATSILQGIVAEELTAAELDHFDPCYEVLIGIRAVKE